MLERQKLIKLSTVARASRKQAQVASHKFNEDVKNISSKVIVFTRPWNHNLENIRKLSYANLYINSAFTTLPYAHTYIVLRIRSVDVYNTLTLKKMVFKKISKSYVETVKILRKYKLDHDGKSLNN